MQLELRPYGTDDDFEGYVRSVDVAVLPYRWGTHSGWAEACLDVGTQVVAPQRTCIPDQHPRIHAADLASDQLHDELRQVLDRCWAARDEPPVSKGWRTTQRQELATAHAAIYGRVAS